MLLAGIVHNVISFEMRETGRAAVGGIRDNSGNSGAITIYGEANHAPLKAIPSHTLHDALILIDVLRNKFELLSREVIDQLQFSEVLIEIHN
jgi:hypothetical protein